MGSEDSGTEAPQFIEFHSDEVDMALERLEDAMQYGERSVNREKVRPSTYLMANAAKDAYKILVREHPDYELMSDDE